MLSFKVWLSFSWIRINMRIYVNIRYFETPQHYARLLTSSWDDNGSLLSSIPLRKDCRSIRKACKDLTPIENLSNSYTTSCITLLSQNSSLAVYVFNFESHPIRVVSSSESKKSYNTFRASNNFCVAFEYITSQFDQQTSPPSLTNY
jgi:hypothetical protein